MTFYKPADGWAADFIPFYWENTYWLFYLHDYRNTELNGEGTPWRVVSTKDFVTFTEHGEVLPRGDAQAQDLYVFTGSVTERDGVFHIFYTGYNPHFRAQGKPEQAIMHAVSLDLIHWNKVPEDTFCAPLEAGYEPHDWRDPFVFKDDNGLWHMLLAARLSHGPAMRRGCTAHCTSTDLKCWTLEKPIWAPDLFFTHECPDYFTIGQWHYLIFSEFTDREATRYAMSKSLDGPWVLPKDDLFDSRAYYAAKSASDGKRRYLFGWNPTKAGEEDKGAFMWGGSLVVHEIFQRANGTLGTCEPKSISDSWGNGVHPHFERETGDMDKLETGVALSRQDGMACAIITDSMKGQCRLSFDVTPYAKARSFGVKLFADPLKDDAYAYTFYPASGQIDFSKAPNRPWEFIENRGLNRVYQISPGRRMHVDVTVDGTLAVMYVDSCLAFDTRIYEGEGDHFALFSQFGGAMFENVTLYT